MKNLFLALSILLVANAYGQDSNMRKIMRLKWSWLMLISMAKAD